MGGGSHAINIYISSSQRKYLAIPVCINHVWHSVTNRNLMDARLRAHRLYMIDVSTKIYVNHYREERWVWATAYMHHLTKSPHIDFMINKKLINHWKLNFIWSDHIQMFHYCNFFIGFAVVVVLVFSFFNKNIIFLGITLQFIYYVWISYMSCLVFMGQLNPEESISWTMHGSLVTSAYWMTDNS